MGGYRESFGAEGKHDCVRITRIPIRGVGLNDECRSLAVLFGTTPRGPIHQPNLTALNLGLAHDAVVACVWAAMANSTSVSSTPASAMAVKSS